MDTQDTNYEQQIYPQADINKGQKMINYELNEIDKVVIDALKVVIQIFSKVKALPPLTPELKDIDFDSIEKELNDAYERSKRVAGIKPPGCEPPTYPTGG